jgi:tetratricopeptide (TPR) repeat protein
MLLSGHQGKVFRIGAYFVLLTCGIWQMLFAYQEQKDFSDKYDKAPVTKTRNVRVLTYHAKQKYMLEADLIGALPLLQQALAINPSYVPAWLSLAELNNDKGEKEKAYAIFRYVDKLTQGLKRWRWEKALTAYQLGRFEMLPDELRYIVHQLGGKERNDALQLAFTLWQEPEELVEKLGIENIDYLLWHAIIKKMPEKSLFFWRTIEKEGVPWQEKEALALLDLLLSFGEEKVAGQIWRQYFNPDQILFDGNFSRPFLGQAFGWRTGKKQNFEQLFDKDPEDSQARILHYRFKGWENINFVHLYQVVPVAGGKEYRLTAKMKSQKLTTDQRPYLEVTGYKCKVPVANSEMVAANQEWTEYQVEVRVPEECSAIVVRLRRKESNHIDNKLAGQLWLKSFVIAATSEEPVFHTSPQQ